MFDSLIPYMNEDQINLFVNLENELLTAKAMFAPKALIKHLENELNELYGVVFDSIEFGFWPIEL